MTIETIAGVILIVLALVILYFSAIGIALMWIVKQAKLLQDKDRSDARKPTTYKKTTKL
jgi:hypothetical protein